MDLKTKKRLGLMKFVYVCTPYRGDIVKNINFAQACCKRVFRGHNIPVAPHLYFPQFMNDNIEEVREFAFELNKDLINMCDSFYVFGSEISEGMQIEIDYAMKIEKPVKYVGGGVWD